MARKKVAVDAEYMRKKELLKEKAKQNPVTFFKWLTGWEPRSFQKKFMKSEKRRVIVVTSRQVGKSEVTAVKAVWKAWLFPNQFILVLSPTIRQSQELFKKIKRNVTSKTVIYEDVIRMTQTEIEFSNGSIIKVIPGRETSVRGFTADVVIIDEAAYVDEAVIGAVEPVIAVRRGQLIMISTPGPPRGYFYNVWVNGDEKIWEKIKATFEEANYDPEFVENYRRTHTEVEFKREILGLFADDEGSSLFTMEYVESVMSDEIGKDGFPGPQPGYVYYIGVDVARTGKDYTAIAVVGVPEEYLDNPPDTDEFRIEVHKLYLRKKLTINKTIGLLKREIIPKWNPLKVGIDSFGIGAGVVDMLVEAFGKEMVVEVKAAGNERVEMYMTMKRLIEERRIKLPKNPILLEHFSNYEISYSSTGRVQIKKKADGHDDSSDAITYAVWVAFNDIVLRAVKVDILADVNIDMLFMG